MDVILPERVWLVRHAETTAPHVFNGAESDVGLSAFGVRQAEAAARWFRHHRPTAVVSSAMVRAVNTAAPIAAACGVPHTVEPGLHERSIGAMAGTAYSTDDGPWPETVRQWSAGNTAYTTTGAESFDTIAARTLAAWRRVVDAHPNGRVVVVAHGIVCKVLLVSVLTGWDVHGWVKLGRGANLSVSELVPAADGRWDAVSLLTVPPPVAELIPPIGVRSEA